MALITDKYPIIFFLYFDPRGNTIRNKIDLIKAINKIATVSIMVSMPL